ncbi:hypothetical protein GCK32_016436 [Trichostrongylus colubriformis]|uniref:Uncharacterized protein n=1 Tax=Trichostrongylus colubriformis TaxID=6319 RepID=A0AAN8F325_TRICO
MSHTSMFSHLTFFSFSDEQQPYVGSQADRNLTLSHKQLNSSCSEKTTRERNLSADCVMPPIEELEKHSLSDVKDADKEN